MTSILQKGYAAGTSVSVEKSRAEVEALLAKHGARRRLLGQDDEHGEAFVQFEIGVDEHRRQVRLVLPLPKMADFAVKRRRGRIVAASPEEQRKAHEQACRERWRALLLLLRAKLEHIALGLSTVEREFLADVYLPDGRTVHQALALPLERAYTTGEMPRLLGPRESEAP